MKILVCGGRDFDDKDYMDTELTKLCEYYSFTHLIHGDAHGADKMAGAWAKRRGIHEVKVPALWNFFGKRAGYLRNDAMLNLLNDDDIVVAFPGGKGTEMMKELARCDGIKVIEK